MKVVINDCHGGFSLSYGGMLRYCELKGIEVWPVESENWAGSWTYWKVPEGLRVGRDDDFHTWPLEERQAYNQMYSEQTVCPYKIERSDPVLVQVVEELGKEAGGRCASLKVVEIPDDVKWHIAEYDGSEWVAEDHRTWS